LLQARRKECDLANYIVTTKELNLEPQDEVKKVEPMSEAMCRKVRKAMVDDLMPFANDVLAAADTGLYIYMVGPSTRATDADLQMLQDTKQVKRIAKEVLVSLRAWARSEKAR
jgi:hypothetical protein